MIQTDEEHKAKKNACRQNPEYKTNKYVIYVTNRLKILSHYSKHVSNSNISCCNCCGENSHVDFLAIDHIAGKNQIDSEPALTELGYSSKLKGKHLINWIIENNYPDGFQILCHNCNVAKGLIGNNNTCTHETMHQEEIFARMEEQSGFEL